MAGLPNQQVPPQQPFQPFDPMQGQYYGQLGQNWQIQPTNYLSQFTDAYNQLMNKIQSPTAYNVGQAGIGQWDMPDYLANLNIGQAGMGGYSSDLLNQLGSTYQQMLTNPNESIAMGLARDQITGAGQAAQQSLADTFAGMGRSSGPAASQMNQLNTNLAQQQANAYRDIGLQSQQQALIGSQGFEQMRGGFYEQQKQRELQNMDQQLRLQVSKGELSQEAYENAMRRELANLGLGLSAWNTNQGNLQNYYSMFPNMLGQLGNMLQFTGEQGTNAQQQSFQNLQGLSADELARLREGYGGQSQYYQNMYNWQNQMKDWSQNPQNVSPWANYNQTPPKWTG